MIQMGLGVFSGGRDRKAGMLISIMTGRICMWEQGQEDLKMYIVQ